ncbi:MAG: alpha-1,2-fucosyltransferase [Kofleriaceae bacterium]
MIIIGRKYGQLGNRLLLFSHWIGFATEYGRELCNPAFEDYAQYFAGTYRGALSRYPHGISVPAARWVKKAIYAGVLGANKSHVIGRIVPLVDCPDGEHYYLNSDTAIRSILDHRVVVVNGFGFRCEPLIEKHANAIRAFFTPAPHHAKNVSIVLERARRGIDVLIGVHIRRGDFRTFVGGRWFYDDAQYARFMRDAAALFPGKRVGFLVVSNEPIDASALGGDVRLGSDHLVEDMYALAGCDYILGPPSTFASWASFYGRVPLRVLDTADTSITLAAFETHTFPRP